MPAVIKKINKEIWKTLREESIKHNITTGKMVEIMVKEHVEKEKNKLNVWDVILKRKPFLSAKEAEEIKETAENLRKGFRMRI